VTFLMSDIEGSTRLLQALGDGYAAVLNDHYAQLTRACADAGGSPVSTEGDAMFFVFRDAPSALRAAADAQRRLDACAWPAGTEVRVRMGVHTGAGRLLGNSYVGLDVHRTARIAGVAHGGQIVLSDTTRALAAGNLPLGVELRDLGEHRLKDLESAERLFQLVTPDLPSDFPPLRSLQGLVRNLPTQLTSFVGREREKRELLELLGANRIVTLTGPGGTGKTRLSIEVAAAYVGVVGDSVSFVALAPISDTELLIPTIAATLGVREVASRPIRDSLIERLREQSMVLVLDNFERLMPAAPAVGNCSRRRPN
jgi:class 3 adenylate cyclase